jgi:hypothetical protein
MIAKKAHLYGKLKTLGEQLHMNVPTEVSLTAWRHNYPLVPRGRLRSDLYVTPALVSRGRTAYRSS